MTSCKAQCMHTGVRMHATRRAWTAKQWPLKGRARIAASQFYASIASCAFLPPPRRPLPLRSGSGCLQTCRQLSYTISPQVTTPGHLCYKTKAARLRPQAGEIRSPSTSALDFSSARSAEPRPDAPGQRRSRLLPGSRVGVTAHRQRSRLGACPRTTSQRTR